MDVVGPIHPPSSRGNKYVLTVIDMLTGFTMAVPIKNKNTETICEAYRDNVYCVFGGSSRMLTDNGSEFKNKEMQEVCDTLGLFSLRCIRHSLTDASKAGTGSLKLA